MAMPETVDVLVVGAGLAGCSLGLLMCRAGRGVLTAELLDARAKDKLCGGVLTGDGPRIFEHIYGEGVLDRLGAVTLDGIDYVVLDKHMAGGFSARALPRKRLDDHCLDAYLAAGGMLADRMALRSIDEREHVARFVDLRTGEERAVRYGVLIGADGAHSKVRRLLTGSVGATCISVEGRVALREAHIVTAFKPFEKGLCWYIPNGDDANVGCHFHGMGGDGCRERLKGFCAAEGYNADDLRGALIPTGEDVLLRAGEDVWLVGDAAGLADKFTGSGMHFALESAVALAESLCGGMAYEVAMAETVRRIAYAAREADQRYFVSTMSVAQSGEFRRQD